jgi:hypothetical protein
MADVQARHSALDLVIVPSGGLIVRGPIGFSIEHDRYTVEDSYQIELHIPDDYPGSPPVVYETEGKIPAEFGHFMEAGNFCLGAPVEVRKAFAQHWSLRRFIDEQVIPYLFFYSFKREHGRLPFDDLYHGLVGLLQYYKEHFGTEFIPTLKLLKYLADDFAPPLSVCPCESGRRLQECHGPKLDELRPHYPPERFEMELREMIKQLLRENIRLPEGSVMPKRMWKQHQRRLRKKRRVRQR